MKGVVRDVRENVDVHDRTAWQYDERMSRNPSILFARKAFMDLVAEHVPLASTLLDFGCGTGLDAFNYAQRGYRVLAYDHSAGMLAQLKDRCGPMIDAGNVVTSSVDYSSFISRFPFKERPQAIVSNFAVLNLVDELEPLFDVFAANLESPGWLIISLWNPVQWTRLSSLRWWRWAARQTGKSPVYSTEPYMSYLHFIPAVVKAARRFRLVGRANAGSFVRYEASLPGSPQQLWWKSSSLRGERLRRLAWRTSGYKMLGYFVFLVLRRDQ
jgi:SAM-dependent methyltransferase